MELNAKPLKRFMDVTDQDLEAERASSLRVIAAATCTSLFVVYCDLRLSHRPEHCHPPGCSDGDSKTPQSR